MSLSWEGLGNRKGLRKARSQVSKLFKRDIHVGAVFVRTEGEYHKQVSGERLHFSNILARLDGLRISIAD